MDMRKRISCVLCAVALCLTCAGALAGGVTLRTLTPFADVDFAAQPYMDIITAWEERTGNVVEDYSGLVDESFIELLGELTASGEADLVVVPAGTGLTYEQLVTVRELTEAAPQTGAREVASMAEADGSVLLTPVRLNWEALYVNQDVLSAAGLGVPTTYEELVSACAALAQKGVTPIANALCEWAETALDCAALMGAPSDQYGSQASLDGARDVLSALTVVGAFGQDPWNATDAEMEALFTSGQAAMRFDSEALAALVPAGRTDSVTVVSLSQDGAQVVAGTPSFGLAITRACWADDARREAALSLAQELLTGENAASLASPAQGELGRSIAALSGSACVGLLYDAQADGFEAWEEQVVATLMGL